MAEKNIPPSPNWFLSSASAADETGVYVYAARMNVYVFDVSQPSLGPRMRHCYMGHTERVTSVALSPKSVSESPASQRRADDGEEDGTVPEVSDITAGLQCCSAGDDKTVKIWMVDSLSDVQSHNEHKVGVTVS